MLLVIGLLVGESLRARLGWPKVIGYVLAGTLFGPRARLDQHRGAGPDRPIADAALGLLMLEIGRRLDLRWLGQHRELLGQRWPRSPCPSRPSSSSLGESSG
jgi:Kef-type K+ transport system membrane component KefB